LIYDEDEKRVQDAIMVQALFSGGIPGSDGAIRTLTVKGFVSANIIAARLALKTLQRPIIANDIEQIISFLKDAEAGLDMLEDKEPTNG